MIQDCRRRQVKIQACLLEITLELLIHAECCHRRAFPAHGDGAESIRISLLHERRRQIIQDPRCDLPIALQIRPNSSLSLSRMKNVICDVSEDDGFLALSSFFIIS